MGQDGVLNSPCIHHKLKLIILWHMAPFACSQWLRPMKTTASNFYGQGAACGQATIVTPPCRALLVATLKSG